MTTIIANSDCYSYKADVFNTVHIIMLHFTIVTTVLYNIGGKLSTVVILAFKCVYSLICSFSYNMAEKQLFEKFKNSIQMVI